MMGYARAVSFDDTTRQRMDELAARIREQGRPEGVPATEVIALHDPEGEKSLVLLFFDSEDDYNTGSATLDAMSPGDTPGARTSVVKYVVAARITV